MKRYVVFMALNERRSVSRIALEGVKRLQKTHDVELFAVTHCFEDWELARKYGSAVMTKANPVGKKFNDGLFHLGAMGWDFDYLLQAGDDDIISPAVLDAYEKSEADVIGGQVMHFYHEGKAYRFHYAKGSKAMMGGGRAISHRMLEKCGWNLWPDDRMNGLDFWSETKLRGSGAKFELIETEGVVDIKYARNIWSIDHYKKHPEFKETDPENVRQITGMKLFEQIQELCAIPATN